MSSYSPEGDPNDQVSQAIEEALTPYPGSTKLEDIRPTRRMVLAAGVGLAALLASLAVGNPEIVGAVKLFLKNPDIAKEGKKLLDMLNNQPSEGQLRSNIVNRGKKINLEAERQKVITNTNGRKNSLRVKTHGIGDSNFFKLGRKNDGRNGHVDPTDQPNSFIQVSSENIQGNLVDIGVESWESETYAVPGAPSGDGYDQKPGERKYGLLGPEQFYNPQLQSQLRRGLDDTKPEEKDDEENVLRVLTLSATGDDWRLIMQNAFALVNFFSKLQNLEHATKEDINVFNNLLAESNRIAERYKSHINQCLTEVAFINEARKQKGLLEIKVVIAHPFSMLHTKHVPFSTLAGDNDKIKALQEILVKVNDDPKDDRYYLDLTKINLGNKIAYLVTVAIYKMLSESMSEVLMVYPGDPDNPWIVPLEWMGLEQILEFFAIDGHPGEKGTPMQAALFLNIFEAVLEQLGNTATLDKIASLSPEIKNAVFDITHGTAA